MNKKVALVIMDGWGLGNVPESDAILKADTPFIDGLYKKYPNSTLITCGPEVGLPEGQMGNSEVGHLNIGAGRIVYQELERINVAIRTGEMESNPVLNEALENALHHKKRLHLVGLVSDGGVHSHISHLEALLTIGSKKGITDVLVHAFTDGRDTDPKSGYGYLTRLQQHMLKTTGALATVTGRYYAMDRDKRWERIRKAYDAMVHGTGNRHNDLLTAIQESYDQGVTDEFLEPMVNSLIPEPCIREGDTVICFNFRTDRCREITEVLTQVNMPDLGMNALNIGYYTMTEYDETYKNVKPLFTKDNLENTLGEVLSRHGKTQLRIAETEKYPHVSFFFSGGREEPFPGEKRIMIPSPKVATYDLQPEMSAIPLTDAVVAEIENEEPDFICLNFANADMVGHTGVWNAVVKAVETVDRCVERVINAALSKGYSVVLTADHGNADYEINADGSPNTAHTLNPVPLFIIHPDFNGTVRTGKLGDIAPTILNLLNIPVPAEMTGNSLI